ncbi:diacylglycerol kinase family protein, partial [Patescibacteria group bacterium]|nr:diacylglycerol kinase family protein [Patescibacteria group bacterium]
MINFKRLGNSFVYAWKGLIYALKNEQNFRIFIVLGAIVLVLMFVFDLARYERIFLLILVFSILILELVNTVFENLV